MKPPSPLLGYNTNVRHQGRVYHIQTEDSGRAKPHVITHLFADGGRILSTKKTGYADHLESPRLGELVKQLMQEQHKAMFIALRAGEFDAMTVDLPLAPAGASVPPKESADEGPTQRVKRTEIDVATLERAASRLARGGYAAPRRVGPPPRPASEPSPGRDRAAADLVGDKSLDEVILGYLAEELDGDG